MWHARRTDMAEQLSRYWDARGSNRSDAATPPADLDPMLVETIDQLYAQDDAQLPDPSFLNRLETTLMNSSLESLSLPSPRVLAPLIPNGRAVSPLSPLEPQAVPRASAWRRGMLAPLATAALVILVLAGSLFAFGPGRPSRQADVPAILPIVTGTPSAPALETATEETLLSWTIPADALPTGDVEALFYRLTLPSGASLPLLAGPFCGCPGEQVKTGVGVEVVEKGVATVRLDAPFTVVRAGTEEEVAAGTEVTLSSGDVAHFPDYSALGEIRTAGPDSVSVLGLAILSEEATGTPVPALPSEVTARELGTAFPHDWRKLPSGPVLVTLRRLSLPPGAELAPVEPIGLETVHVVEGEVGVAFIPAGESEPSRPLVYLAESSTSFRSVPPGVRRVVSNDGDEPATILVLRIAPASEGSGTPLG